MEKEFDLFEKLGLIEELPPHEKGFFSQTLILEKPGTRKPRIPLDLRRLNKRTKMVHYPLPGTQIVVQFVPSSWKVFSVLNIAHGLYNIEL